MKHFRLLLIAFLGIGSTGSVLGQAVHSVKDGNWDDATVWSTGTVPNFSFGVITIQNNVTVTSSAYPVGSAITIDQTVVTNAATSSLIIQAGAQVILNNGAGTDLTFNGLGQVNVSGEFTANTGTTFAGNTTTNFNFLAGSTYEHKAASAATNLPTATYNSSSTLLIDGYTGGGTLPATFDVPLGNVVYDCPSQAAGVVNLSGNLRQIQGSLTVNATGASGRIYFNQTGTSTLSNSTQISIGGSFVVTPNLGTDLQRVFLTTTGTVEVYVAGNFTFSPNSSSANSGSVAGNNGSGKLQVTGTTTMTNGTWNFSSGTGGDGIFNLYGDLICNASTVTLTETGGGTSQGNINFIGTSGAQNFDPTSATLTAVVNLTVNNSSGVNLLADLVLPGGLNLTSGALSLPGISFTADGAISQTAGSISASGATFIVGGAGALPANLPVNSGSGFSTFELNRSATTLTTTSSFTVTNLLLYAGTLTNTASAITMDNGGLVDLHALTAANTGKLTNVLAAAGSYDVQYTNNVALTTGVELPSSTTALNNLIKLGTNTLTVAQNITINGNLTVSAGTISDGGTARTISLAGNYASGGTASTWTSSTFNFTGASTLSGTIAPAFDILNFSNSVGISVGFGVKGNLSVSAGSTVTATAGTCTFNGTTTVTNAGTLNLYAVTVSSTLNPPAGTLGIAGALNITGTFNATPVGTILFNGATTLTGASANKHFNNITIAPSSSFGGAVNWILNGTIDNSGTLDFTAGTLTVSGAAVLQNTGSNAFNAITISVGQSLTANADFSMSGSLAATGNFTSASNTVTITGANTLTGAGTKTFKNIIIAATGSLTPNNTYTVTGNYTVNGTLNAGTSTTTFGGTTAMSGTGSATFDNVTISASDALNVTMPITISGTTLTNNNTFSNTALTTFSHAGTTTLGGATGTAAFGAITINNGTTLTPNQPHSISGNLIVNGTLSAGSNTATFNGTTAISGTPTAISFLNVTISGSLTSYSGNVTISGNVVNNGTFAGNGGTITFAATAGTKTVSGTSAATFSNITVNNGAAATDLSFTTAQKLSGVLTLAANAVVSSGGFLTLLSTGDNPAKDATIAAIPAGANITGNVNVQRYMSPGASGIWRYLSSPVTNATVSMWQNYFSVTGNFTGKSTVDPSNGTNVVCGYTMVPTSPSLYDYTESNQTWNAFPTTTSAAVLVQGQGYSPFIRNCTTATVATLTGPIYNASTVPFSFPPLTYTSGTTASLDGYNLVGNPFASAIDWGSAAGWTKTNIGSVIAVPANGTGSLVYHYLDASSGPGQYVASGQAFWVVATAASPALTALETVKVTPGSSYQFYRQANPVIDKLVVAVTNGTVSDSAFVKINPLSVSGRDNFDGPKLYNGTFDLSTTSTDNVRMAINSTNSLSCGLKIPLGITYQGNTGSYHFPAGSYTFSFSGSGLFNGYTMTLTDSYTGVSQNVSQTPAYSFSVTATAGSYALNRFYITLSDVSIPLDNALDTNLKVCGTTSAIIKLNNPAPNINYFATIKGKTVSDTLSGKTQFLQFTIPSTSLKVGQDTIVFKAQGSCSTFNLNQYSLVQRDTLYAAKGQPASNCGPGSVVLTSSGAPAGGSYNWYQSDSVTLAFAGAQFTTPVLTKSRSFYVAAVNRLGCEGTRVPVLATIVNYTPASIIELNDFKTLQSNYSTGNQWYFNDQLIQGARQQTLLANQTGWYKVSVNASGCSTSDSLQFTRINSVTGIENGSDGTPSVYPNPASGRVTIQAALSGESSAKVIDNLGRPVGSLTMVNLHDNIYGGTFDFTLQSPGIYIVEIMDGGKVITLKVVHSNSR